MWKQQLELWEKLYSKLSSKELHTQISHSAILLYEINGNHKSSKKLEQM